MPKSIEYDLNQDFVSVRSVFIKEQLSDEDIKDGLEAEEILMKVAISKHALKRMEGTYGRECEWELIEELIERKGSILFGVKNGEEFILLNEKKTLALVCQMYMHDGECALVLNTVIRKIVVDSGIVCREKEVYVDRSAQKVL